MKFELFIARRYLTKGRRHSFISVISMVSIIGITIGVAALVIALSLINGFQEDIRDRILSSSAHLMITPRFSEGIENYQEIEKTLREKIPEILKTVPVVYGTVLVKGEERDAKGAVLRGIPLQDPDREEWLNRLESGNIPDDSRSFLVGWEFAVKAGLVTGSSCSLVIPQPVATPMGVIPKFKRFQVAGIFRSGLWEFDSGTVITSLAAAQNLLNIPGKIHYLQIHLTDLFAAEAVASRIKRWLPAQLNVITWGELNASLYSALKLEKTVLFFTLTLIIIVASLNIIAGLFILVTQKIRDIGILFSYGATPPIIRRIFFIQGSIIGLLGTIAGLLIGLVFCLLANKLELIRIPSEIYQITHIRFQPHLLDILLIAAVSLLISFSATLIPSRKASQIPVVEAVKYE